MTSHPIKIKIMTTRPEVTDEEIRNSMDFDNVLRLVKARELQRKKFNRQKKIVLFISGIALLIWIRYLMVGNAIPTTNPKTVVTAPLLQSEKKTAEQPTPTPEKNAEKNQKQEQPKQVHSSTSAPKVTPPAGDEAITEPATYTEAEPVDGFPALYEYFNRELKYPAEALKDSVQGIITVKFVINELGQPGKIEILNSLGTACDHEAFRLIENMPRWKPARLNGKPVASKISVPLTFQIKVVKAK